jgi:hypothetical protein|tara:strand:- start:4614 stop:4769 length:156 start_codon:yes stop_codon:yes gene_type:complete
MLGYAITFIMGTVVGMFVMALCKISSETDEQMKTLSDDDLTYESVEDSWAK